MDVIVKGQPPIEVRMEAKVVDSYKTADAALSESSVNPVQNKVVTAELNKKATKTEVSSLSETLATQLDTINEKVEENKTATDKAVSDLSAKVDEEVEGLQTQLDSNGVLIEDLQESKADVSGYYPQLHVGLSDNLPDRGDVNEGLLGFRESAGAGNSIEDGTANVKELLGESLVWNQKFDAAQGLSPIPNGITYAQDGLVFMANGTANSTSMSHSNFNAKIDASHKYIVPVKTSDDAYVQVYDYSNGFIYDSIFTATHSADVIIRLRVSAGTALTNYKFTLYLIDLTKMFGAGNEPSTIEEFEAIKNQLVGVDFNAYNEGEVLGVNIKGIKSVNDNAWDEEWEVGTLSSTEGIPITSVSAIRTKNFIKVLPSSDYYVTAPTEIQGNIRLFFYDADKNVIKRGFDINDVFTLPSNAHYMKLIVSSTTTYNHDICIRLAHSGYKTDYVAHEESESSFDLTPYFPNGMHGINGVRDSVTPKNATRRYGVVDLGSLNWIYDTTYGGFVGYISGTNNHNNVFKIAWKGVCVKYPYYGEYNLVEDKGLGYIYNTNVFIKDSSYTDAATFKTAMSGVMLYHELATPIETEIDPQLNMNYKVWDFGTEELLTDSKSAPVLARTIYGFNATDTIRGNKATIENHERRITDLENEVVRVGDYQPDLTVGVADQLAGHEDATPSEIGFRRSGGGAILDGNARIEAIKGNSAVWNQQVERLSDAANDKSLAQYMGLTYAYDESTNILTINGTSTGTWQNNVLLAKSVVGHTYFISAIPVGGCRTPNGSAQVRIYNGYSGLMAQPESLPEAIGTPINTANRTTLDVACNIGDVFDNYQVKVQYIDLTQMFGAGNEPTTIEEFYARKPIVEDEYAYNEGEVIHMDVQSLESVGANAWDEQWENGTIDIYNGSLLNQTGIRSKHFQRCIPNTEYYVRGKYNSANHIIYVILYDKDYKILGFWSFYANGNIRKFSTGNAEYFKITTTATYGTVYNNDIFFGLYHSGLEAETDNKHKPYEQDIQQLPIIRKYFPNGMKSAGTAHDEIRYNKASGKREYSKGKMKEVDMGTLSWNAVNADTLPNVFHAKIADIITPSTSADYLDGLLCTRYGMSTKPTVTNIDDMSMLRYNGYVYVKDTSYANSSELKSALSGVMLYYESNDWEWTEIDETINLDYLVWNAGTEKAVANVPSTPLKADIVYGFNAYGVIKELLAKVAALEAANASLASQLASVTSHNEEV